MARAVAYMKTGSSDQLNALISYSCGVEAAAAGNYAEALTRYEDMLRCFLDKTPYIAHGSSVRVGEFIYEQLSPTQPAERQNA
jgi:hypothetical protein